MYTLYTYRCMYIYIHIDAGFHAHCTKVTILDNFLVKWHSCPYSPFALDVTPTEIVTRRSLITLTHCNIIDRNF